MMLAIGFLLFSLVYVVYSATSLGRINSLPPLPEQYKITTVGDTSVRPSPTGLSPLERKLEQAFGKSCKELGWPTLLELNAKSMVLAADKCDIVDGGVRLSPMSVALFGKKKNDGRGVEINTLKCQEAYIKFDQPVISMSEINGRKLESAKLYKDILVVNNRRTPGRDDDLNVFIKDGPLCYDESKHFLWTNDEVDLQDGQTHPPKAKIHAKGMEMELTTASPPPKPGVVGKPKNDSISGVKRIVLKQDVNMDLRVAGPTPFPGGSDKPAAPATKEKKSTAEQSHVLISTPGRFRYDLFKDHDMAYFDVPEDASHANNAQDVVVTRVNRTGQIDQITCKHLELRMKRSDGNEAAAAGKKPAASDEQSLEIETAHAKTKVKLTSEAEKLLAHGDDFFYDARKKLTILQGAPYVDANKDNSLIYTPRLQIQDVSVPVPPGSPPKTYQHVVATGPGSIHLPKKVGDKVVHVTHAFWREELTSTREGDLDLLVLTGKARFVDDEQGQSLQAEKLKVWLLAEDKKPDAPVKKVVAVNAKESVAAKGPIPPGPEQSRRPRRIEALKNVTAKSRDLFIHDTSRLVVRFKDVPPSQMPAAKSTINGKPAPKTTESKNAAPVAAQSGSRPAVVGSTPGTQPPANPPKNGQANGKPVPDPKVKEEPPRPVDLTARSVEADVLRCGERSMLDHLWAEGGTVKNQGGVQVRQEGKPGERGVYIEGSTLQMRCYPEGNTLEVAGDLAHLKMDKITIAGPEISIDQVANVAFVHGRGFMLMQSNTTLDGKPLNRTVPLEIHWRDQMLFEGDFADFRGDVQANQENANLACQFLQVVFDKPISLKEGNRGDRPAKVRSLSGDKNVRVEDKVVELFRVIIDGKVEMRERLQKYQRLEGSSIRMTAVPRDDPNSKKGDANRVELSGPGTVRILQRGGAELTPTPVSSAPPKPNGKQEPTTPQEMKMTFVSFEQTMQANNESNTASFWGSVRVLNFPCEDEQYPIDLDVMLAKGLWPGAMYLSCNQLKVKSVEERGKSHQLMDAVGHVHVEAKEFTADCDEMKFDERKDQVVFIAAPNRTAVFSKDKGKGARPDELHGKRIIYNRRTGKATIDDIDSINGN
jgi:hypothetical protein